MVTEKEFNPNYIVELYSALNPYKIVLPCASTDYIQKKIAIEKIPYEIEMLRDVCGRVAPGDLFVDIGANIGNHSLFMAACGCEVVAFEPNIDLVTPFLSSIALNNWTDRVMVRAVGVGKYPASGRFDKEMKSNLGAMSVHIGDGNIEIVALDSVRFKNAVAILKIDVEGMEFDVLNGAEKLLEQSRPIIYIECLDHQGFRDVFNWLSARGYVYWDTFNASPTHLFMPIEKTTGEERIARLQFKEVFESYRNTTQLNRLRRQVDTEKEKSQQLKDTLEMKKSDAAKLAQEVSFLKDSIEKLEEDLKFRILASDHSSKLALEQKTVLKELLVQNGNIVRQNEDLYQKLIEYGAALREALVQLKEAEAVTEQSRHITANQKVELQRLQYELVDLKNSYDQQIAIKTQEITRQLEFSESLENNLKKMKLVEKQYKEKVTKLEKVTGKFKHLESRMRKVEKEKSLAEKKVEETKNTLSYQLGCALILATKSWSGFLRLPLALMQIRRESNRRRRAKILKSGKSIPPVAKEGTVRTQAIATMRANISHAPSRLRVAGVMDEFTFHSYNLECELLQLHPERGVEQLKVFKPDLLFIESAWKGLDGLWQTKISNRSIEIIACIEWCKTNGVPTLFWNKEDPVHFGTFVSLAKEVDFVFTTDIDCIPKYKYHVGHERVYLLPFAAQPFIHNPIELYKRKDAFNFAGSYYLRYPERQRDFAALIDTVKEFRPVDIYDRNFDNPHPHYTYPDQYKSMILGSLPFSEIDRAYKGYRYGINMNTIKQSQTMFARRVFELLASNTVVVSNFSRGVRLLFGDLVVSSDDAGQIQQRISSILKDESTYRKFRLLGLRKVMAEHTYAHRMAYIRAKLSEQPYKVEMPLVVLLGNARNADELVQLKTSFRRQKYVNKRLMILTDQVPKQDGDNEGIEIFVTVDDIVSIAHKLPGETLLGLLGSADHYGENYLTDLVHASSYSKADAFGKVTRYMAVGGVMQLHEAGWQYRWASLLSARAALVRKKALSIDWLINGLYESQNISFQFENMLAIDEFNYIENGAYLAAEIRAQADDLLLTDLGVDFETLLVPISEALPSGLSGGIGNSNSLPQLTAADLQCLIAGNDRVQLTLKNEKLYIKSTLEAGKHSYIYARKPVSRAEFNMVLNSQYHLICEGELEVRTVFEFQDNDGQKISHQMNTAGEKSALAIPAHCTQIRLGLRIFGPGELSIEKLVLGSRVERPAAIVCRSSFLVLAKQYPAYDDLYRYGFLHSRIRAYKESGLIVDVFRISNDVGGYREFENFDIATGNADLLDATLAMGQVKNVLVHLLDENMWRVLKKYIDRVRVTIWVHGAEIQVWERRQFEFKRMDEIEILRQKKLSDKRKQFWRELFQAPHKNLHFIFVSKTFALEVIKDIGVPLSPNFYEIIHNPININLFRYTQKPIEQRKKVLSIRPYVSNAYANDLSVECILILSKKPWFKEMEFLLIGDGPLFDSTLNPLKGFGNVKIEKRFLTQREIADLHKEYGIFLCPTRMDTQGVSRDEAMSSGLVPVTNAVAAVPEFVDENSGILAQSEDAQAMADGIEKIFLYPDLFLRFSKSASDRVKIQANSAITITQELEFILK